MTDLDKVRRTVKPETKLIWTETLSNPMLKVYDIESLAEVAHANDAVCACDNTFVTPVFGRPLELGVDLVIHSTTK